MFDSIRVNSQAEQGKRTYMEDEVLHSNNSMYYLSAVFDGHGGKRTSKFLKNNFVQYFDAELENSGYDIPLSLYDAIKKINDVVIAKSKKGWTSSGSTANIIVLDKISQQIFVTNVGDSRAIICNRDNSGYSTKDHKANDPQERKNIERRGGFISEENRVNGTLLLARAVGDVDVHKVISCEPDLFVLPLKNNMRFILQATDGLFDVFTNYQLCTLINKYLDAKWSNKRIVSELIRQAIDVKQSGDNVSIILIAFQ